jgi:sugar lactone lactonase YvrE
MENRTPTLRGRSIVFTLSMLATALAAAQPAPTCAPDGDASFVCGQAAPEDLVRIPGTPWVVASSFTGSGLSVIDVRDKASTIVYPAANARNRLDKDSYPDCPGAPESDASDRLAFNTHGLAVRKANDGQYTLHVVHHGKRESVEVFTLDLRGQAPSATWVGCVVAPDPVGLNAVVGLPDGGFIATNFRERGPGEPAARAKLAAGENHGELWEWHARSGWQKMPGSEASGPNGVELSPDGKWIYVGAWGGRSLIRLSRGQAESRRETVPLGFRIDNIRWGEDGLLYGAGQGTDATDVVKLDPATLKVTQLIHRANTPAFGAGTTAIPIGQTLWVGSYKGERIAIFPVTK